MKTHLALAMAVGCFVFEAAYQKALADDPKDDNEHAEIEAWYIRREERDKGEDLLAQAFARKRMTTGITCARPRRS